MYSFKLDELKQYFPKLNCSKKNFYKIENKISFLKKKQINNKNIFSFKEFDDIYFPFVQMGKISSHDLICANEFIIFFFYYYYYKAQSSKIKVADFGANIGLHSIIMSKCGFDVTSFEPDPDIFLKLKKNIKKNKITNIKLNNNAIFNKNITLNFTRVLDNLTGSHITSEKKSFGPKDLIKVRCIEAKKIVSKFKLIKIDIESAEAKVICSLNKKNFLKTDMILEIGNKENAMKIFKFLIKKNLKSYSQKNNFNLVSKFSQMPISHKDGMLLISQTFKLSNFNY